MSRRTVLFCAFAALAAMLFLRLGFWQLDRRSERRARNAMVVAQQRSAPVPWSTLPSDPDAARYRAASVEGRYEYEHELVLSGRTHQGSPGVELITPVRIAGTDTAVLVNRGWVYSPDGGSVDLAHWREGDTARVAGYVEIYSADAGVTTSVTGPRIVRRASRQEIVAKVPYPIAPYYLVSRSDTATINHPARRDLPALDEGPHGSYAVQWFFFAAVAIVGATAVVLRERQEAGRG
jgi:surfeit locus 1 family protein